MSALKVFSFFIHSHLLLAFAAVALAVATQVQFGMNPHTNACLALIFFATLLDYNFHRYKAVRSVAGAESIEKLAWAAQHLKLVKFLIVISFSGLLISLPFVSRAILFALVPLAFISFIYSFSFPGKPNQSFRLLKIPGLKTLMIAIVWSAATVLVPVLQLEEPINQMNVLLIFAERFTFIFAIAIPFDIRDMEADKLLSIKTIPQMVGKSNALRISNLLLVISFTIATGLYLHAYMGFILAAYLVSIVSTYIFTNNKALKKVAFYYPGILDGCILLHGLLIFMSSFFLHWY